MSQEFPTASLDITEDFHILHSAYVYICSSILKAKTYNWLLNTHTHTHAHTLLCSNEGMLEAFALVWQTAQNGRLHKTGGTYNQSCMYPTDSAWPAFLMPFLLLLPSFCHLSRDFTVPPTKRAYSALHTQAFTECSPLDFRRSSFYSQLKNG